MYGRINLNFFGIIYSSSSSSMIFSSFGAVGLLHLRSGHFSFSFQGGPCFSRKYIKGKFVDLL